MKQSFMDKVKLATKGQKLAAVGLVSVLVLGGAGTVVYQNHQSQVKAEQIAKDKEAAKKEQAEAEKKAQEAAKQKVLDEAETKVKYLEQNQKTENVSPAQTAVDKVEDKDKKATFQKRIDAVKAAIEIKAARAKDLAEAESKVKALEDNQVNENIDSAQNAVNKVADQDKKNWLQSRIDAVKAAIAAKAAQAAPATQATQTQADQANSQPTEVPSAAPAQASDQSQGGGYTYVAPADTSSNANTVTDTPVQSASPSTGADYGGTGPGGTATQDDVNRWDSNAPKSYNLGQ